MARGPTNHRASFLLLIQLISASAGQSSASLRPDIPRKQIIEKVHQSIEPFSISCLFLNAGLKVLPPPLPAVTRQRQGNTQEKVASSSLGHDRKSAAKEKTNRGKTTLDGVRNMFPLVSIVFFLTCSYYFFLPRAIIKIAFV